MSPTDFSKFIDDLHAWSLEKCGEGVAPFSVWAVHHGTNDNLELVKDARDLSQWAELILIGLDGAARAGYSGKDIITAILAKHMGNMLSYKNDRA